MAGLPERTVTVRGEKYTFRLVPGLEAFNALRKLIAKTSTLIPDLIAQDNNKLNENFYNLIMDDIDELLKVFIDKNQLKCNGIAINDFDEHFAGKPIAIAELLYKVIMENDKDFFHSLPSLLEKGLKKLNTKLQENSLTLPEGVNNLINEAVMKTKENLG